MMDIDEPPTPAKNKGGRPRKLDKGEPGKVLSGYFSPAAAERIAELAARDQMTVSEWLRVAALERLERIEQPRLL
jgi:hypothetical protein